MICCPFVRFAHLSLSEFYYYYSGGEAHHDALTELARENLMLKHQLHSVSQEVAVYVSILFEKRHFFMYPCTQCTRVSILYIYPTYVFGKRDYLDSANKRQDYVANLLMKQSF